MSIAAARPGPLLRPRKISCDASAWWPTTRGRNTRPAAAWRKLCSGSSWAWSRYFSDSPCHSRNCRRPRSPTRRARGFRAERRGVASAMPLLSSLKQRARHLKSETLVLWFAARHPGTPWYAKLLVAGIVAYALSPIDLIPDFIPVLGYVDDLILIPLGIVLAIRMIPGPILEECRAQAQERMASARPVSRFAALVIVGVWLAAAALCALWAYRTWFSS